jgi:epoxide hydrolase-like predicted phosphatase
MKINAIIVDVGGVLVRELDRSARKIWETKLHLSHHELTREVYRTGIANLATVGKADYKMIWLDVKKKFNLTDKEAKQIEHDFHAGDRLNTEFYAFMQELHKDYKTAIISNAWLNAREIYTEVYHLDKIVDQMVISAEEGMRKPNKTIFKTTLNRLGVKAEEAIYIDDRPDNIRAASALGMNTALFTHTQETIERIKSLL